MKKTYHTPSLIIMGIGVILFCVGLFMKVPSKELTTYTVLADSGYSVIEEYVGGDAYNFIIGAALVGGEIAGIRAQKAIYTVAGLFFFCAGMALASFIAKQGEKEVPVIPVNSIDISENNTTIEENHVVNDAAPVT